MPDDGAIARNAEIHRIALERASRRNGSDNPIRYAPNAVTGAASAPSQAIGPAIPEPAGPRAIDEGEPSFLEQLKKHEGKP